MKTIDHFKGKYYFLSNFYPAPVVYNGITYKNNEAAFQAQKEPWRAAEFANLQPNEAKRRGRRANLRTDWEDVKDQIMYDIVLDKFRRNPDLEEKLIATGNTELIEGNDWGDTYWGVCEGKGKNKLGKILMEVRSEIIQNMI